MSKDLEAKNQKPNHSVCTSTVAWLEVNTQVLRGNRIPKTQRRRHSGMKLTDKYLKKKPDSSTEEVN
jgi:hypothetical protein